MSELTIHRPGLALPASPAVKALSVSTGLLVALLAAGAFTLSFDALNHLAQENGVTPGLTWVWPLVLDGAIVVFSLSALRASLHRESIGYPMGLVVIATATSVLFNVAHAPEGMLAHTMAALPPVFLFLSFELLMRQLRSEVERSAKRDGLKSELVEVKSASVRELLDKANLAKADKIKSRCAQVAELAGQELPPHRIAEALGVSAKTIKRDLAALDRAA